MPSKKRTAKKADAKAAESGRTRQARPYPASSFKDALPLGEAILKFAAGEKVRRLTLLQQMDKSPTSSGTKMMITNSGKYGITKGSYAAEHLELTEQGRAAVDSAKGPRAQRGASFELGIKGVEPFNLLYEQYKGKRLPEREVMKDVLTDSNIDVPDTDECVDTFTVNVKDLDLLRTIGGAETLVSIEQVLDELPDLSQATRSPAVGRQGSASIPVVASTGPVPPKDWSNVCFYITPIGADDSVERRHSDLLDLLGWACDQRVGLRSSLPQKKRMRRR